MRIHALRKGRTFSRMVLDARLAELLPTLSADRILDLGSKRAPYRQWLRCRRFEALDLLPATGPDLVGDAHRLPIRDGAYDAVIATQVLEHCHTPERVVAEIHRVLKPGGVLVVSVPFVYVLHADPWDFWRFTEYALRHVLRPFAEVQVWPLGNRFTTLWDYLTGHASALRYLNRPLSPLVRALGANPRSPHGYLALARKGGG